MNFAIGFITELPIAIQEMGLQCQSCLAECGQEFRGGETFPWHAWP